MPARSRPRIEPTDDWAQLQLGFDWPEQVSYELIRPAVLFGATPAERAEQTGVSPRTNYSRAILASGLSRSQDLTAFLIVLFATVRQHGAAEALISDSGGIFLAKEAKRIYRALKIEKEQIDRGQPGQ